jgi:hypothetical protein
MYHLHLALPDLVVADPDAAAGSLPRLAVLEQLLARADQAPADADWRRWVLSLAGAEAPPGDLPVARTIARHGGLDVDAAPGWLVATPVRLVAGMASVHFDPGGPVEITPEVAAATAARHGVEWSDSALTLVALGGTLLVRAATAHTAQTRDPATLAGLGLAEGRPLGPDALRLERVMTELQMWLHDRPLVGVDGRAANGLWLWGGGDGRLSGGTRWPVLGCADPFLSAAAAAGASDATRMVDCYSVADLVRAGRSFADADARWFAPLAARLRDGEVAGAELHCRGVVYTLRRSQRWRAWRRSRPWWERLG